MSDPIRYKSQATISIDGELEGERVQLYLRADKEKVLNTSKDAMEQIIKDNMTKVTIKPGATIYKAYTSFSYSDSKVLKSFDFANLLIEVHLPYCLHIPNHYEVNVNIPEQDLREAGFEVGDELNSEAKKDEIRLKKK